MTRQDDGPALGLDGGGLGKIPGGMKKIIGEACSRRDNVNPWPWQSAWPMGLVTYG